MSDILIRPYVPQDYLECLALNLSCVDDFTGFPDEAKPVYKSKIQSHQTHDLDDFTLVLVAQDGDKIIGMGGLDKNEIRRMYVARAYRGQGVGKTIYSGLEQKAIGLGVQELFLDASLNAAPFYEKLGFQFSKVGSFQIDTYTIIHHRMTKTLCTEGRIL
jgi:N-acetylglutamate synthase-like GNAT family acetyltransferase